MKGVYEQFLEASKKVITQEEVDRFLKLSNRKKLKTIQWIVGKSQYDMIHKIFQDDFERQQQRDK